MIYSDVSCHVEKTLKKVVNLGIDKILKVDFFALVTMTKYGDFLIDGEINFSNMDHDRIVKLLKEKSKEIDGLEDGKIFEFIHMDIIVVPVRAQDNYKVFCICCSFDKSYTERDLSIMKFITKVTYENVLLDNEIIKERNYLQNLFNSVHSFIIGIDTNGIITTANRGTLEILGLEPEKIIGKSYSLFLLDKEKIKIESLISDVINQNKSYNAKEEIFSSNNRGIIFIDLTISPINNNKQEVAGVVIIGTDITKRKIYEREIEQLKQFALLGELAAGVAHDIKNPLMSIRGCARILEKKLYHEPKCKEFIEPIINEVDRINETIEQMLSYSFITQEDLYSLLDINEVLNKCFNVVAFHKESKYINIEKKFSEKLPLIRGNNVQLQQAFINILMNAIEAIETEGLITIESCDRIEENKILVSISDNGKGMSKEKVHKIFQPFYTSKSKGHGFGLSIVERVIKQHGGKTVVSSEENKGTVFNVYLPY